VSTCSRSSSSSFLRLRSSSRTLGRGPVAAAAGGCGRRTWRRPPAPRPARRVRPPSQSEHDHDPRRVGALGEVVAADVAVTGGDQAGLAIGKDRHGVAAEAAEGDPMLLQGEQHLDDGASLLVGEPVADLAQRAALDASRGDRCRHTADVADRHRHRRGHAGPLQRKGLQGPVFHCPRRVKDGARVVAPRSRSRLNSRRPDANPKVSRSKTWTSSGPCGPRAWIEPRTLVVVVNEHEGVQRRAREDEFAGHVRAWRASRAVPKANRTACPTMRAEQERAQQRQRRIGPGKEGRDAHRTQHQRGKRHQPAPPGDVGDDDEGGERDDDDVERVGAPELRTGRVSTASTWSTALR
jgi:hypothetical protein